MTDQILHFPHKKHIVLALAIVLTIFVVTYGIFLQNTVDAVVTRSNVESEIADIRSDIGSAEQTFGTHVGSATLTKADTLGFQQIKTTRFITRTIDRNTFASANAQNQ